MTEPAAMDPRLDIIEVVDRYGRALDQRDWELLHQVFTPDVEAEYGRTLHGVDAIVAMVRAALRRCGPTQHLFGNHRVHIQGATATCVCAVRAFHAGAGEAAGLSYELFGEYEDELIHSEQGWRIRRRRMRVHHEQGPRAQVLG